MAIVGTVGTGVLDDVGVLNGVGVLDGADVPVGGGVPVGTSVAAAMGELVGDAAFSPCVMSGRKDQLEVVRAGL